MKLLPYYMPLQRAKSESAPSLDSDRAGLLKTSLSAMLPVLDPPVSNGRDSASDKDN
jgi:hypothetical protein